MYGREEEADPLIESLQVCQETKTRYPLLYMEAV